MKRTAHDVKREVEELCERSQGLRQESEQLISELSNLDLPRHPMRRKAARRAVDRTAPDSGRVDQRGR